MKLLNIYDFDNEVQNRIRFFQNENKCIIKIYVENDTYGMIVMPHSDNKPIESIELCSINENKYALIKAIRKHFKPDARF